MSKPTFAERCQIAQQLLPYAQYRAMLTALHAEMLDALAEQPAQQNSPWCMKMNGCKTKCEDCPDEVARLQKREWAGLTADEMLEALTSVDPATQRLPVGFSRFACAIEAKLKEKNT